MKKINSFFKKNLKWVVALFTLILFIFIIRSVCKNEIVNFDNYFYQHISLLISDNVTFLVKMITNLGSAFSFIFISLLILLIPKNKRYGILVSINLVVIFLFNGLLKIIFARPRPTHINLIEEFGYSFPSAHAMVSTAFYGFLIYLIWKAFKNKTQKWLYSIVLSIIILLICTTRVYLVVHYASDVFGGMLISISYLVLFTSIISKYLPIKKDSLN